MNSPSSKRLLIFCLAVYLLGAVFSIYALTLKRAALGFQSRDYSYFIEQAVRLADSRLSNRFALNIEGYNFLGLQGTEGVKSIYHAIHTEYFRYTYAGLFFLFRDVLPVYIFYVLIFFSPVVYFALIWRSRPRAAWQPVVFFALLYVLFPALISSLTFELRPRVLFIPAWCLASLAILHRRPFREKLVFFLFLFSIREESILLGAALLAMNFFATRGQTKHCPPAGATKRRRETAVLLGLDLAAAAAFAAFMAWGEYTHVEGSFDPLAFLAGLPPLAWGLAGAGLAGLLTGSLWIWRARRAWWDRWWMALAYSAGLALTGFSAVCATVQWYSVRALVTPLSPADVALRLLTGAQNSLFFYMALLPLCWALSRRSPSPLSEEGSETAKRRSGSILLTAGLAGLCLLFAGISALALPGQLAAWSQAREPARLVWEFKRTIDRYRTQVLVDYDTFQAFYDVENTLVYQRLPLWMVYPEHRDYPDNQEFLVGLIRNRGEFAVISRGSLANVRGLEKLAGVPANVVMGNEKFVVLSFKE